MGILQELLRCWSQLGETCQHCKHNPDPCLGEKCPDYISGTGATDDKGNNYPDFRWSCKDFSFGECPKLENTPCNGCIENGLAGFVPNEETVALLLDKGGEKKMYEITIILDAENLCLASAKSVVEAANLIEAKNQALSEMAKICKRFGIFGKASIDMLISHNGEYIDHDTCDVVVVKKDDGEAEIQIEV